MTERNRSTARASLVRLLTSDEYMTCDMNTCDPCNFLHARYTRRLKEMDLLPLSVDKHAVYDLAHKISHWQEPTFGGVKKRPCYYSHLPTKSPRYFEQVVQALIDGFHGLCIDCVKAGGRNIGKCRIGNGCSKDEL